MKNDIDINKELENLFIENIKSFDKEKYKKIDYSNPLLMKCWKDYITEPSKRILYVGRETNSWYSIGKDERYCFNEEGLFNVTQLMSLYQEFDFQYSNDFFNLLHKINLELFGIHNTFGKKPIIHNFLWTNIFKMGRKCYGKGRPRKAIQTWEYENFNIFRKEVMITKPAIIIYVTGHTKRCDEFYIRRVLDDAQFIPINGNNDIIEVNCPSIKIPMYRIPRPEIYKHDIIIKTIVNHFNNIHQ